MLRTNAVRWIGGVVLSLMAASASADEPKPTVKDKPIAAAAGDKGRATAPTKTAPAADGDKPAAKPKKHKAVAEDPQQPGASATAPATKAKKAKSAKPAAEPLASAPGTDKAAPPASPPAAVAGSKPATAVAPAQPGQPPKTQPKPAPPAMTCALAEREQPRGGRLDVIGTSFGQAPVVRIAQRPARMIERRPDRIGVQVPADSDGGEVTLHTDGRTASCGTLVIVGKDR